MELRLVDFSVINNLLGRLFYANRHTILHSSYAKNNQFICTFYDKRIRSENDSKHYVPIKKINSTSA